MRTTMVARATTEFWLRYCPSKVSPSWTYHGSSSPLPITARFP